MVLSSASPHLPIHGGDQGCLRAGVRREKENLRRELGSVTQPRAAPALGGAKLLAAAPGAPAQQMNPSGRCTVQLPLLPRAEVILEGILFIQEIFLEIFTCQDYMFKFFDEASSGPLAEFLRSFASIAVGFSADKRIYCSPILVGATNHFPKLRGCSSVLETPVCCSFYSVQRHRAGVTS